MSHTLLVTLHIAGAVALFTTFGALLAGNAAPKKAAMFHGISLLLILLVGFAMLRKPPMGQYWWMVKLGLWLFLGAAPALAKRGVLPRCVILTLCLAAGIFAAWLGLAKPF
jgi:asparagine N-glycosylation enzyme membrane subunit Stt3